MIRAMAPADTEAVVGLAIEAQMFPSEAADFLREAAQAWFDAGRAPAQWVVDQEGEDVVGVAFFEPREATDRV